MIFATGDTHGNFQRFSTKVFPEQKEMTRNDYVIICGDFGGIWATQGESEDEKYWLNWLEKKSFTTLFVDGNHENFDRLDAMPVEEWHGGKVHKIRPHVLHLMRGQVFDIDGFTFFTMGGGTSHDIRDGILDPTAPNFEMEYWLKRRKGQMFRVKGVSWWPQELPSAAEYEEAQINLKRVNFEVDYIITHCCATSTLHHVNSEYKSNQLTDFLEEIRGKAKYHYWLFGHYHDNRAIDSKHILLWEQIVKVV